MRERLSSFDMVKHEREVWEMRNEDTADMWFYIIRGTFGAIQMSAFFNLTVFKLRNRLASYNLFNV